MSITCPNRRLRAWKDLVKVQGESRSYLLWSEYEGNVPDAYYQKEVKQPSLDKPVELGEKVEYKRDSIDPLIEYKYFRHSTVSKAVDVLKLIAKSDHPLNKLAEKLIPYAELNNVDIELSPTERVGIDNDKIAVYNSILNKISIAKYSQYPGKGSEVTLLHEIIHAVTYNKLLDEKSEVVQDVRKLLDYAREKLGDDYYGLTNEFEFISELFTDSKFVKALMKIDPINEVGEYKNFLEELLDYILSLFELGKKGNLYIQSFAVVTNILEQWREEMQGMGFYLADINELTEAPEEVDYTAYEEPTELGSKAILNKTTPPKPYFSTIKSSHIKPAVINNQYVDDIKSSDNKRYITSHYFRYKNSDGSFTIPYYPFTLGNIFANQKLINMINSEFGVPVVRLQLSTEAIVFTEEADIAMSMNEVEDILYTYQEEPAIQQRMEEIQPDILGEEEILYLKVDTDAERIAKNKERDAKKLEAAEIVVKRKKELIRLLHKRMAKGSERRAEIQARIDRLQAQVTELIDKAVPIRVLAQAEEDNVEFKNRLINIYSQLERADSLDANQLWSLISELNEINSFIKSWLDIAKFMDFSEMPDIRDRIANIGKEMSERRLEYLKLLQKAFLAHSNKTSFKKFGEELFDALEDESWVSRMTLGAQFSNSDIVRIVNDLINKSALHINVETYRKQKELDLWYEKVKKHTGLSNTIEISKMFLQYDKDGNWTGNIVGKISQAYFDKKKQLRDKAEETGSRVDWKAYYDFVNKNSVQMTETIFKSKSHASFTAKDFEIQERLLKEYEKAKKEYKRTLEEGGVYGTFDAAGTFVFTDATLQARFTATMSEWDRLNRPFDAVTGEPIYVKGGNNWKYRVYEKPDVAKWGDEGYKRIQKDPVLKEFYEFMLDRFEANNEDLPYFWGLQSNYLPELRRTALENFTENKTVATFMSMANDARLDTFTEATDSEIESGVTIAGVTYKSIPTGMMANLLIPEQKSKDIFRVLKAHTDMALNYKYKSQVEPIAIAAQDLISEVKEIEKINDRGEAIPKRDIFRDVLHRDGKLYETRSRLEYLINAELYSQRKKSEAKGKKIRTKSTGEEVVTSLSQSMDSLIKFTYVKALSMPNVITPTVNLTLGISQNYIYASAGRNIDNNSLTWAYSKIWLPSKLNNKDGEMVVAWMRHLNILDNINEAAYGKSHSLDRWLTQLQSRGEYINQGAVMLAYLKKNKLVDKNGNEISIIDAFKVVDGDIIWDKDKMGEMTQPEAHEIFSEDRKGLNMFRLRMKIKGINFYIHGDYASALQGKETSVGRAIMLFKTWLFQTWMHRFGREMLDPNLQETVKGRYRSYTKVLTKEGQEIMFKDIMKLLLRGFFSNKAFDSLSDLDRDNLVRNMREFQIVTTLGVATYLIMAAFAGDEPEKDHKVLNLMINMLSKTQVDMMFYLNPSSTSQVLNNLVAPINTVNDMIAIWGAIQKTIEGDYEYKSGPWKDQNRIVVVTSRNIPVVNGGIKMWNMASKVYAYN
jgi:hypothetical protein